MSSDIESILRARGPELSSVLVQQIVDSGVLPEAARQRVSRVGGSVKRLKGINFPNRESFLFIDEQFGKHEFLEKLTLALQATGSAYGRALTGLQCRGGSINSALFPIASGLPVENAKRQLLHSIVENKLQELRLISKTTTSGGEMISLWNSESPSNRRRAVITAEEIMLSAVRTWLVKMGWSSSNSLAVRSAGNLPRFGQFAWDIVGPCYLAGISYYEKGALVHGFICADIVLDHKLTLPDIRPFLSKWESIQAQKRRNSFQPMIIAEAFESDALNELRKRGALIAIPAVLFGEDLARDLRQLIGTIENAAAAVTNDPQSVFTLIERVSKIEGAALNLRGVLIEMIVAHLYKLEGYDIDIRQQVRGEERQKAEIDVKAKNRREVVCCECKGKAPNSLVDAPEIKEWVETALPRIKYWLKQSTTLPDIRRFEFISSTAYTKAAIELIGELEAAHKKQPIKFLSGKDILNKLQAQKEKSLADIFREQFSLK